MRKELIRNDMEAEQSASIIVAPENNYPVYRTVTLESVDRISHSFVKIVAILCGFGFLFWISHSLSGEQVTFL